MKLVLKAGVVSMKHSRDLNNFMKKIYYLDFRREPIINLANLFFEGLRLYERVRDPDLWHFLYDSPVVGRLRDAFSRKNNIDGETMQRELNGNPEFAQEYHHFNRVYKKLVEPFPEKQIDRIVQRQTRTFDEYEQKLKRPRKRRQ